MTGMTPFKNPALLPHWAVLPGGDTQCDGYDSCSETHPCDPTAHVARSNPLMTVTTVSVIKSASAMPRTTRSARALFIFLKKSSVILLKLAWNLASVVPTTNLNTAIAVPTRYPDAPRR
jgi:hypothetical protein